MTAQRSPQIILFVPMIVLSSIHCGSAPDPPKEAAVTVHAPVAKVMPDTLTMHGYQWVDPYAWMKDVARDKAETIAYVEAENAYTDAMMKRTEALQTQLFQEMKSRIKETDLDVPERDGEFYYYTRTEQGEGYPIYCRKKGTLEAAEEILLDVNLLAAGASFYDVDQVGYSPDHSLLSFAADTTGAERYALRIKDLEEGQMRHDEIYPILSVAWAQDNQTLFYTRTVNPEVESPYQLYRHRLGTPQSADELLYQEEDLAFGLGLWTTRSKEFIVLGAGDNETSELHLLRADDPFGEFRLIKAREPGVQYSLHHWEDSFLIVTNGDGAKNYKVMRAASDDPAPKNWSEFLAHRESVYLTGFDVFRDWVAIHERTRGLEKIRVIDMRSQEEHEVSFPEPTYTFYSTRNPDYNADRFRISYMSLVTPHSVYDYHFGARELELLKRTEVLGDFDPATLASEYVFAPARDGVEVPISLVYRQDLFRGNGSNPLYLYAYGSYGETSSPWFSANRLSLLDRGFVYAIAHIRGGDELGRDWHDQGKLLNKKNTFNDFIDSAEFLLKEGYGAKDKLVISGGSAGGMLMGVVANLRPELFSAVIAHVPAVDELHHMLDPELPGVLFHYTEWGNPNIKEEFEYFRSWDAYSNIRTQDYPHILATSGLHDPRVPYWQPAKWVAKLRTHKTDDNWLLLKTNMSGHMGASGRYEYLKETALEYSFILDRLGIEERPGSPR